MPENTEYFFLIILIPHVSPIISNIYQLRFNSNTERIATVCYLKIDLWPEKKFEQRNFFLKYLCSERVFYLCREIRKGSQTTV